MKTEYSANYSAGWAVTAGREIEPPFQVDGLISEQWEIKKSVYVTEKEKGWIYDNKNICDTVGQDLWPSETG